MQRSSFTTAAPPGARDRAPERAAQVRAIPAEPPDLDAALPALLHHRHRVLLGHLHVRLPEVHGLHQPGEGEAGKKWGNEIGNVDWGNSNMKSKHLKGQL